jgi:hypothetical protein
VSELLCPKVIIMRTSHRTETPVPSPSLGADDDINIEEALAHASEFYLPLSERDDQPALYAGSKTGDSGDGLMTNARVNVRVTGPIPKEKRTEAGEIADYLDDLGTIMSAHVRDAARADRTKFYDLNTWEDAYRQLELMMYKVIRTYKFSHQGAGAEVSTKIVQALIGAVAGNKLAAGKAFLDFLSEQQGRLKAELGAGNQAVRLIAMSTAVVADDDDLGRLHGYINLFLFDESNSRKIIETSCASAHRVDLRASGMQILGEFHHRGLRRKTTKDLFEKWVEARINDSMRTAMQWKKTDAA